MLKSATITIRLSYFLGVYDVIVELCDTYGACSNVNLKAAITVLGKTFTEAELDQAAASITATLKTGKTNLKHEKINKRRLIFSSVSQKNRYVLLNYLLRFINQNNVFSKKFPHCSIVEIFTGSKI